jgi:hypothetical protein
MELGVRHTGNVLARLIHEGKIRTLQDYIIAISMAFVLQWISEAIYVFVALLWLIPDRRIESRMMEKSNEETPIH